MKQQETYCPVPDSEPMMIVNDLSKIFHNEMRRSADEAGVPSGYRNLLRELARHDGSTQLDLSKATRLKPPTVSITIRKMEADGYVTRQCDSSDMRVTRVFLTEKGAEVHRNNRDKIRKIDECILKDFTDQDRHNLMRLLLKMRKNLCEGLGVESNQRCQK